MAESQCALLGKSTNLLIAIERPVWLTGRQRQQKAGHCDHLAAETGVFLGVRRQGADIAEFSKRRNIGVRSARPENRTRGLLNLAQGRGPRRENRGEQGG
jgi:hypothetical protein